jgi:tRNA threonylcarbamoyladenosine modification (KEOPS) complex Cgi121 subunit
MRVFATATIAKEMLNTLSVSEIEICFQEYAVELRGVKIGDELVILKIYGKRKDIELASKSLYKLITEKNFDQTDRQVFDRQKTFEDLKNYLKLIENEKKYQNHYEKNADEYIKHCALNDINPHPEVIEGYAY